MSGLGEEAATEMQGESGVYPTEACEEVAIPGVDGLLCLIGAVIVRRAYLIVYSVSPGKTFQGPGHLLSMQSAVGLRPRSRRY